uniref:Uncharacterized protein n=1 Tax=Cucumis melo TaxID=3656 RepID=A0A9I9DV82_CUCME
MKPVEELDRATSIMVIDFKISVNNGDTVCWSSSRVGGDLSTSVSYIVAD